MNTTHRQNIEFLHSKRQTLPPHQIASLCVLQLKRQNMVHTNSITNTAAANKSRSVMCVRVVGWRRMHLVGLMACDASQVISMALALSFHTTWSIFCLGQWLSFFFLHINNFPLYLLSVFQIKFTYFKMVEFFYQISYCLSRNSMSVDGLFNFVLNLWNLFWKCFLWYNLMFIVFPVRKSIVFHQVSKYIQIASS